MAGGALDIYEISGNSVRATSCKMNERERESKSAGWRERTRVVRLCPTLLSCQCNGTLEEKKKFFDEFEVVDSRLRFGSSRYIKMTRQLLIHCVCLAPCSACFEKAF